MSFRTVQKRLRDGARWVVIGRIIGIGTTFLLNALLARVLGPSGFGGFVLATTLMALLSLIGMVGFNEALVRFISERLAHKNTRGAALVVRKGLRIATVFLVAGAPLAWLALTQVDLGLNAVGSIGILSLLIVAGAVALAYQQLGAESLRGYHQLPLASVFAGGQTGGLLCTLIILAMVVIGLLFERPSLTTVLTWYLLALLITLPLTYLALWSTARSAASRHSAARKEAHVPSSRQMLSIGGSIMIIHTLAFFTQQADLWIAGAYCPYDEVGLYGSARRLTLLAAMPVQIAMLAVISSIADLHVRGKRRQLQVLLRGAATFAAIPAGLALMLLLLAPGDVLALIFGEVYRAARFPLVILALGYLPLILCGNPVHALTMTGRHRVAMTINLLTTCVLLGLGPVVARQYGTHGLACVSSATLAVQNLLLWLFARLRCQIWTHVGSPVPIWQALKRDAGPVSEAVHDVVVSQPNGQVLLRQAAVERPAPSTERVAATAQPVNSPGRAIWWLHPVLVFAVVVGTTTVMAAWMSSEAYRQYGAPKYFTNEYLILAFLAIGVFTAGAWVARLSRAVPATVPTGVESDLRRWFFVAGGLALLGYIMWGFIAVRNGLSAESLARFANIANIEAADDFKQSAMQTVPGLTTATQFGIAAFLLGGWLWTRGDRWVIPVLSVLTCATLLRTVLNSERLALLEVAVPAALVILRVKLMERSWSLRTRRIINWAPLIGVVAIFVAFGATEYPRSWRYYRNDFQSFAEFTVWRSSGYYTTAMNNGAMANEVRGTWPLPYSSLHALWAFPLVEQSAWSYEALTGVDPVSVHLETLERYGNPELNNASGLYQPLLDFGLLGFALYWLLYGWVAGSLHRSFLAGSLSGLVFYPIVFLSLLEVPRILYLPSGRVFPALAFMAALVLSNRCSRLQVEAIRRQPRTSAALGSRL